MSKKAENVRLNLEVNPSVRARLDRLKEMTEADSITEVVRRALIVYEKLVETDANSQEVIIRSPSGSEKAVVLIY